MTEEPDETLELLSDPNGTNDSIGNSRFFELIQPTGMVVEVRHSRPSFVLSMMSLIRRFIWLCCGQHLQSRL